MSRRHEFTERLRAEAENIKRHDGSYSPSDIVAWAAKHKESAWHKQFQWDDTLAGHEFRLLQARWAIRRFLKVEYGADDSGKRVSVPMLRGGDLGSYMTPQTVMTSEDFRLSVLEEQKIKLWTLRSDFESMLVELAPVWRAIARTCRPD